MSLSVEEAERLAASWQLALRARRKSPGTLESHGEGVRFQLAWCADHDLEPLTRANLNTWTATCSTPAAWRQPLPVPPERSAVLSLRCTTISW